MSASGEVSGEKSWEKRGKTSTEQEEQQKEPGAKQKQSNERSEANSVGMFWVFGGVNEETSGRSGVLSGQNSE